jgi:hypothetical protein
MKKLSFILIVICLIGTACEEYEPIIEEIEETDTIVTNLVGTKWKLVGFVDVEADISKEPEPKDCGWWVAGTYIGERKISCYYLEFTSDSTFFTFSSTNQNLVGYSADYETNNFEVFGFGGTRMCEIGDGWLYYNLFIYEQIQSFSLQNNELHLYYNDKMNYLLFKLVKP